MGLHTIDTVRRDAAEKRLWFETKRIPDGKAEVVLTGEQARLVYTIDMENDVIQKIKLSTNNGKEGELKFSYLQNVDNVGSKFAEPKVGSYRGSQQNSLDTLWLMKLINNSW